MPTKAQLTASLEQAQTALAALSQTAAQTSQEMVAVVGRAEQAEARANGLGLERDRLGGRWASAEEVVRVCRRQREELVVILAELLAAVDADLLAGSPSYDAARHETRNALVGVAATARSLVEQYRHAVPSAAARLAPR